MSYADAVLWNFCDVVINGDLRNNNSKKAGAAFVINDPQDSAI